jgi:hypothetical protein
MSEIVIYCQLSSLSRVSGTHNGGGGIKGYCGKILQELFSASHKCDVLLNVYSS